MQIDLCKESVFFNLYSKIREMFYPSGPRQVYIAEKGGKRAIVKERLILMVLLLKIRLSQTQEVFLSSFKTQDLVLLLKFSSPQ